MPLKRAVVLALMRKAQREGTSFTRFTADLRKKELAYKRSDMRRDWDSVGELQRKEGALRFVRRDFYPSKKSMAEVEWDIEYMFKVKVHSRLSPDEPMTERWVNIMSDRPMTPTEIEQQVVSKWGEWEKYAAEELVDIQVWSAIHGTKLT